MHERDYKKTKLSLCKFLNKGRRACQYLSGLILQESAVYFCRKMEDDNVSCYVVRIIRVGFGAD